MTINKYTIIGRDKTDRDTQTRIQYARTFLIVILKSPCLEVVFFSVIAE